MLTSVVVIWSFKKTRSSSLHKQTYKRLDIIVGVLEVLAEEDGGLVDGELDHSVG